MVYEKYSKISSRLYIYILYFTLKSTYVSQLKKQLDISEAFITGNIVPLDPLILIFHPLSRYVSPKQLFGREKPILPSIKSGKIMYQWKCILLGIILVLFSFNNKPAGVAPLVGDPSQCNSTIRSGKIPEHFEQMKGYWNPSGFRMF